MEVTEYQRTEIPHTNKRTAVRDLTKIYKETGGQARDNSTRDAPVRCPPVKISSFSGSEDLATWITKFEVIAHRFRWSEEEMLDQLLPGIGGLASHSVFSQLRQDILDNYRDLTYELSCRFQPIETAKSFASKFSRRSRDRGKAGRLRGGPEHAVRHREQLQGP